MTDDKDKEIGKIIGSNSHVDYVCEIYNQMVRDNPPDPTDYEFGQFVYVKKEIEGSPKLFIGVIYNTRIVDPDQGRSGPRLAQPEEQDLFYPTYVDEKSILAGIALLGHAELSNGELSGVEHSIPRWTLEIDDVVRDLADQDMVRFHDINGEIRLEYYQRLIDIAGSFAEEILKEIIDQLEEGKPEEADALDVIRKNLEWQTRMREV
ncbi:MAG: hypothetical protein ACOCSA_01890 [Candidatus Hadarchaeota archaeon]